MNYLRVYEKYRNFYGQKSRFCSSEKILSVIRRSAPPKSSLSVKKTGKFSMIFVLQQRDSGFAADIHRMFVPYGRLYFADMRGLHHEHTQS